MSLSPINCIEALQSKLEWIAGSIRYMQRDLIVAGDFNAKTLQWVEVRPIS